MKRQQSQTLQKTHPNKRNERKIPKGFHVYSRNVTSKGATPQGSYVALLFIFYKHLNPSDSLAL